MQAKPISPSAHPSSLSNRLCFAAEGVGEAAHIVREWTLVLEELDVGTVTLETTLATLGDILFTGEGSEAPVLANNQRVVVSECLQEKDA